MGKIINYVRTLSQLCTLINRKSTGDLKELSVKLGVSERTAQRLIRYLKDEGVPLRFCRYKRSYQCGEGYFLECSFKIRQQSPA